MVSPTKRKPRLARDGQQWLLDWVIQETGKAYHHQTEGRGGLPRAVHRHVMISKHIGLAALRMQRLAEEEEAAGHRLTALNRYFEAATMFAGAQHTIFENTPEKQFLHGSSIACYDHVRELAPYKIEHVNIEWADTVVSGNLHLASDKPAPCVFFVPGCDMTKEGYPHPLVNHAVQRGMHIFSFDGPGQGESNLRGTKLTANNYEEAASKAIDYLVSRPEIQADKIGIFGRSFGSYWAMRIAATDNRVKALAGPLASYCAKYHLMDEDGPRWKMLFLYLTGARTEEELDRIVDEMTLDGYIERISCPTLMATGEYDPRSPLDEVYEAFDRLKCPAELWVFADQYHGVSLTAPNGPPGAMSWFADHNELACDWLRDRFDGRPMVNEGKVVRLETGGTGPYAPNRSFKRQWYEGRTAQAVEASRGR